MNSRNPSHRSTVCKPILRHTLYTTHTSNPLPPSPACKAAVPYPQTQRSSVRTRAHVPGVPVTASQRPARLGLPGTMCSLQPPATSRCSLPTGAVTAVRGTRLHSKPDVQDCVSRHTKRPWKPFPVRSRTRAACNAAEARGRSTRKALKYRLHRRENLPRTLQPHLAPHQTSLANQLTTMCISYTTVLQCCDCHVVIDRWRDNTVRCDHPSTCGPRRRVEQFERQRGTRCQRCQEEHVEREIERLRLLAEVAFNIWRNRTRSRGSGSGKLD